MNNSNKKRKVKNRKEKEQIRGKFSYVKNKEWSENNNLLPNKYLDQIICGDSKEVLNELPNNCIDLILTSPPYNFGLEYKETDDATKWDYYFENLFSIFDECIRILKYGGRIVINIQPSFSDYLPTHHIISNYFMNKGLIWKAEIIWDKKNYNCNFTTWGSWKSPSSPYMKYTWEFLEVYCKGDLKKDGNNENIDITGEDFKKWVNAKWEIHPEMKMKKYDHPAMFPQELAYRVLQLFSFQKDIILDPFSGTGTTSLVAKKTQRHYLGIDISKDYCLTARDRLQILF